MAVPGAGREITKGEALKLLVKCEDLGLVHQTPVSDQPGVICNCCPCCCGVLHPMLVYGVSDASVASRFRPAVDEAKCINCLSCTEVCHFSAMVEDESQRAFVAERCLGCGLCAHACPQGAIRLMQVLPAEHILSDPASS